MHLTVRRRAAWLPWLSSFAAAAPWRVAVRTGPAHRGRDDAIMAITIAKITQGALAFAALDPNGRVPVRADPVGRPGTRAEPLVPSAPAPAPSPWCLLPRHPCRAPGAFCPGTRAEPLVHAA